MPQDEASSTTLHASCVARNGQAVLIRGASGSGKSGLALQLIAMGATLVADDRTLIRQSDGALLATAPDSITGQIEARGVGILAAETTSAARLGLIVDLDETETERLPPYREVEILGVSLPLLHHAPSPHFAAAIWLCLQGGRCA